MELETRCGLTEDILDRYFYKSFRLSIKLWINKESRKLNSWDVLVKKTIRSKEEVKICISASRNIDQRCHQSTWPINTRLAKKPYEQYHEKAQTKPTKNSSSTKQGIENSKAKAKKEKKKDWCKRDHARNQKGQEGPIPAIEVNAAKLGELSSKKKKNKNWTYPDRIAYDLIQVKCSNCQNWGYYANNCLEPSKN